MKEKYKQNLIIAVIVIVVVSLFVSNVIYTVRVVMGVGSEDRTLEYIDSLREHLTMVIPLDTVDISSDSVSLKASADSLVINN